MSTADFIASTITNAFAFYALWASIRSLKEAVIADGGVWKGIWHYHFKRKK